MNGRIEIQKCHGGREIVGSIDGRMYFRLEEILGDWEVTCATTPDGSIEKSRLVCLLSLECFKVMDRVKLGVIDIGFGMKV